MLAMAALRPVAFAIDLVDRPNERKRHRGEVPLIGGLAILLGMLVAFGFVPDYGQPTLVFVSGCALLCTLGMLDDRFDLSPWARLPVQAAVALVAMYGSGLLVTSLGAPFGGEVIRLEGVAAFLITLVLLVGAINAFNMLDGMDGLAGAMAVVAFAFLGFAAYRDGLRARCLLLRWVRGRWRASWCSTSPPSTTVGFAPLWVMRAALCWVLFWHRSASR